METMTVDQRCPTCGTDGNDEVARAALGKVCDALGLSMNTSSDDIVQAIGNVDPYGPTAQWRGGSWCGNESCPCAAPNLPCREWMGCAETGAFCPCCGWNEAAHRIARKAHRRRVQRWRDERPAVATVRRISVGFCRGCWVVAAPDGTPLTGHHGSQRRAMAAAIQSASDVLRRRGVAA